jgi:hypothetical protein
MTQGCCDLSYSLKPVFGGLTETCPISLPVHFCRYAAQLKVSLGALAVPAGADEFGRVGRGEGGNGGLRRGRRVEDGAGLAFLVRVCLDRFRYNVASLQLPQPSATLRPCVRALVEFRSYLGLVFNSMTR